MKNDTTIEVDGVMIPVNTNGNFWGAEDKEESQGFVNFTQKMTSLYLSRFSFDQIKKLVPEIAEQNEENTKLIIKMIHDVSTRKFRQNFIKSLEGNVPHQLNFVEMSEAIKVVGYPAGRSKKINVAAIIDSITFDIANVDLIKPAAKTPSVRTRVSREFVEEKIVKLGDSRNRANQKLERLNKRAEKVARSLENDSTDAEALYMQGKVNMAIARTTEAIDDINAKIGTFTRKLEEISTTVEAIESTPSAIAVTSEPENT